ncbi:unnamed protein product, partial [Echinostoma caproni]|uniref:Kinesin light chain n=1 Tax=Echinostoma caproni TaxID=27848 RepID=A0A183B6Q6_9TREM
MTTNQDESKEVDVPSAETSLLNYTLKQLVVSNAHMIAECEQEMQKFENQTEKGDHEDCAASRPMNVLLAKMDMLELERRELESASDETNLIRHVLAYREILESAILRTQMRYKRLREENTWLQNELKHFEIKSSNEANRAKQLREKIAHFAFIYHQRRSWADSGIPSEMCALPSECEGGQEPCAQIGQKLAQMRTHLPKLNRISADLTDSMDSDWENDSSQKSEELLNQQIENESPDNRERPSSGLAEFGDTVQFGEQTSSRTDWNTSNSGKMTLSELRELMLEDSSKETKRLSELSSSLRRPRGTLSRDKSIKQAAEFSEDLQLSDLEKETLKQCMKTLDPQTPHNMQPKLEPNITLDEVVEQFVRSKQRTQNLAIFVDLVRQFNHKEMRSPGIGLCWMAINGLRRYERELRTNENQTRHMSPGHLKRNRKGVLGLFEPGTLEEVEYRNVLDDLCRLLSIVSHLYRSRNELSKAAECLKDLLKIRRSTHTWRQLSVAQALSNLAWIQSSLKDCNAALTNARKSLHLRRDLISDEAQPLEQSAAELSVAKQSTSLALMLMYKQQTEQKKLRYHRFPFREVSEIPTLLNEAIRIGTSILESAESDGMPLNNDWDCSLTERQTSTVGDCRGRESKFHMNPVEECLLITRNALSVYF